MAGSERSGPLAASAALFDGRPWAVTPHETSDPEAVALVEAAGRGCAAPCRSGSPRRSTTGRSPGPRTCRTCSRSLVAGRLADAPAEHLALSGQGVRDVTRVAGGDPALYGQIVTANADAVLGLLGEVRDRARRR